MTNTISLRAYKTLRECQRLFQGYRDRISAMDKAELLAEVDRYKTEAARYPHHLLTVVKGEILMAILVERGVNEETRDYAQREERRLKHEMQRRLQEEWSHKRDAN